MLHACSLVISQSSIPESYYLFYAGVAVIAIVLTYNLRRTRSGKGYRLFALLTRLVHARIQLRQQS